MKKSILSIALISASTLSGCATILQGTEDTVNVHALGASEKLTECTIKQGKDSYRTLGRVDQVVVGRGSADMLIKCENDTQQGTTSVESSFQGAWLAADLLWDLCIITLSCPIDAASGAFFDYPNDIHVDMVNKDGTENVLLAVHKEELAAKKEAEAKVKAEEKAKYGPQNR
ncbi:hypothetical protein [Vibrio owensii]|uniref:hypothetical protein n=1 Tax=Vibrio owensii TaxID=696485 RepID=UPI0018F119EF|nr:hypothetical protein [Vibrio owensii]